jgi:hypothetical protein
VEGIGRVPGEVCGCGCELAAGEKFWRLYAAQLAARL